MNLIPQSSNPDYLQFTSNDPSTTFGNIIIFFFDLILSLFCKYLDSPNLLTYQTWSSNDDNSNSSLINKSTRRRNSTIVYNGPKRPVGRPPKKLQQQKNDEIIIQQSESNSLIEQIPLVRKEFSFKIK
jgi:hypothetical protein